MFSRTPKEKPPIPFTQKLITLGLIVFFAYIYFTQYQNEQLKKHELLKTAASDDIKITNLLTKEILTVDPTKPGKTTITIKRSVLEKTKDEKIDLLQIEVPEPQTKSNK